MAVLGVTFNNLSTRKDTGLDSWRALGCVWVQIGGGPRHWPGKGLGASGGLVEQLLTDQ